MRAAKISTCGNKLIHGFRLVDVQPQNQVGKGSIAFAQNLSINPNAKTSCPGIPEIDLWSNTQTEDYVVNEVENVMLSVNARDDNC